MPFPNLPIDSIVSGYRESFDWLARATSRPITVFVDPHKSGCPNHVGYDSINKLGTPTYNSGNPFSTSADTSIPFLSVSGILNVPFSGGNDCPVCNNNGFILGPTSGIVSARIQFREQMSTYDLQRLKLKSDNFDIRIKVTGDAALDLLDRSIRVIVDGKDCGVTTDKIPVGLRDIHTYYYFLKIVE